MLTKKLKIDTTQWKVGLYDKFRRSNFILESYTLDSASAVLQAAAADADMSSEDLALSFVNGEMTIEEFKKKFVNARTDAHKLKLKSEKILQQATNQQSAYSGAQISSGAPPTYQHYRFKTWQLILTIIYVFLEIRHPYQVEVHQLFLNIQILPFLHTLQISPFEHVLRSFIAINIILQNIYLFY